VIDASSSSRIGLATAGLDSAAIWTENFDSVYPLLDVKKTLLNGREAAV
jgi:hypothetical protein